MSSISFTSFVACVTSYFRFSKSSSVRDSKTFLTNSSIFKRSFEVFPMSVSTCGILALIEAIESSSSVSEQLLSSPSSSQTLPIYISSFKPASILSFNLLFSSPRALAASLTRYCLASSASRSAFSLASLSLPASD